MSVSKLTIVANLQDELTGPLKRVTKALDDASRAADKTSVSADRQADAFNRLAKEAKWSTDEFGRWHRENGRFVSRADRAAMGTKALSLATHEAARAAKDQADAYAAVIAAAGWKIHADGRVRNSLGHYVSAQKLAIAQNIAASNVTLKQTGLTDKQSQATARATKFSKLYSEALDLEMRSYGYTRDAQGKILNVMGKYAQVHEVAFLRSSAMRIANEQMGEAAAQAAVHTARAGEEVGYFSRRAFDAAQGVERLAGRLGMGETSARRMGVAFGNSMNNGAIANSFAWYKRNLDDIYSHAQSTASKIESAMGKALKVGGVAATLGAGYAIKEGMTRLNALEQADVKLQVQDFNPEEREAIKGEVDQMVRGTFLSLPQALDTAQGLLGSGVEYGPEFTEYMSTMVDAQSIYSSHDPKQLELVMRQIESKEILTGEERNQLAELGMPVNEWIAEQMGIQTSEVMDAIENREVTSDIWWKAMGQGTENGAELMGQTFTGAWLNFLAAVKRSGQFFDEPLLEPMRRGMNMMTDLMDENQEFFTRLGMAASVGMSEAVDTIPKVMAALEPLGPSVIRLVDALSTVGPQAVQGFAAWLDAITPLLIALIEFTTILLEIAGPALPVLIPLLMAALTIFKGYAILKTIVPLVSSFFAFMGIGTGTMTASAVAMSAASGAATVLAAAIKMFPGTWLVMGIITLIGVLGELYDEVDWIRDAFVWMSDAMRNADEWVNNLGDSVENFFSEKFPKLAKLAEFLGKPLTWASEGLGDLGNNIGEGTGLHEALGTGRYANTGEGFLRMFQGSGSLDENGDPMGGQNLLESRMTVPEEGVGRQLEDMGLNNAPNGDKAVMLPGTADQSVPGFADGGWTGPDTINVGERGREFITQSWAANSVESQYPGAMDYINDTGSLPPTGAVTIQANINIDGAQDPELIRTMVEQAIRDAAREANREYMNADARGAG